MVRPRALRHVQALDRLASEVGYDIEVLVEMQHGEPGEFRGSRGEQVRHRNCPMLASVGEKGQDLARPVLDSWCDVLDRHRRQRWPGKSGAQVGA